MKKAVMIVLGFLVVLGIAGFASAECSGDSDQVIMKFSSLLNAHGALWNQAYDLNVCYNDLFTEDYSGTTPHECDGDDTLLYLNTATNAHVASSYSSLYNIAVCHKGVKDCNVGACPSLEDGGDIDGDGKSECNIVAYISGNTNAHISNFPFTGGSAISCFCTEEDCESTGGGDGGGSNYIDACYTYTKYGDSTCGQDPFNIALSDPGCPDGQDCSCFWDVAKKKCGLKYGFTIDGCTYDCKKDTVEETECSGGSKILSMGASAVLLTPTSATTSTACPAVPADLTLCKSGSVTVTLPCQSLEEAGLPFFGVWQLVLSAVSIVFVYAFIRRK